MRPGRTVELPPIVIHVPCLSARMREYLKTPATPTELAEEFNHSLHNTRSILWSLEKQGRVKRVHKRAPKETPRGRKWEYLWIAA